MGKNKKNKSSKKPSIPTGNNTIALKPKWQHIVLIVLLTAIVYSNTLNNDFVYDDTAVITKNTFVKNMKNITQFFTKPIISSVPEFSRGYRPLTMASFAINYAIGGHNPTGYHIVNILLHTFNVILVYLLVILLIGRKNTNEESKGINYGIIAFFISLIFAVHPINSEAVNYIWQRSVLLSTFFYLTAILLFIRNYHQKKPLILIVSLMSFILALLSKEIAITFPLIIILIDWYFISNFKRDNITKNIKRYHVPSMLIAVVFIFIRFMAQGAIKEFSSPHKATPLNYLIIQFQVIIKYIKLIFFPYKLSIDHYLHFSDNILNVQVLLCLFMIIIIILLGIKSASKSKTVSLGILWFFITLIPTSSIIPLMVLMNEHRLYLPGIGMLITVIIVFKMLIRKLNYKVFVGICIIVITILSIQTYNRNAVWKNSFTLWSNEIRAYPDNWKGYNEIGNVYMDEGSYDEAITILNKAIKLDQCYSIIFNNRGLCYKRKGEGKRAIEDFKKAIKLNPIDYNAYNNMGATYIDMGIYNNAIEFLNKTIELNPYLAMAYYNRGMVYDVRGLYNKAIMEYTKAIELDFGYAPVYYERGIAYTKQGLFNEAIKDFNKVVELNPTFSEAYRNRGNIYKELEYNDKAIADFNNAIKTDLDNYKAYNCRGDIYLNINMNDKAISDYNKAIELNPENFNAYINRSVAYTKNKSYEDAINDLSKAININPNNAGIYKNRSIIYRRLGNLTLSKQDEEKAKALQRKQAIK